MNATDVRVWIAMAVLTACIDMTMMHRRFSGKLGPDAQARQLATAGLIGGVRVMVGLALAADLLLPPIALGACLFMYVMDRRK